MSKRQSDPFLQRLRQDQTGNTLAIMAASIIPMIGVIGGSVDMARVYITKTSMQQACDAGALAGRKAMGAGSWTTSGQNSTKSQAEKMFAANFVDGDYGSENLSKNFTEADGTVTGTSSTVVPLTLMRIFNMPSTTIEVTCTAQMEIPNTDVMFVLDLTASMNCPPGAAASCYDYTPQTGAKITGLKSAVKCFYEALLKVNTDEVCGTTDPSGSSYGGTAQIRLGFVPYDVNVNVGRLLPNTHMVNAWTYDSRVVNTTTQWAWTAGSESDIGWGNWTPATTPASYSNASAYTGFARISGASVTVNGTNFPRQQTAATSTNCASTYNTLAGSSATLAARSDTGQANPPTGTPTTSTPAYPATDQTVTTPQTDARTVKGYRYRWFNPSGSDPNGCWLEVGSATYDRTRSGTSTKPLTWTQHNKFTNFTYRPVELTVSGLKAGDANWNTTVSVPTGITAPFSITPSGSKTPINIQVPQNDTVTWDGCIEERQTVQNTDGDMSDDWGSIPAAAWDMQIDLVPTDDASRWKPMLQDVFWGRYTGSNRSTGKTLSNVTTATDLNRNLQESIIGGYYCPLAARKLASYTTAGDFTSYVDQFTAAGFGTYHDIGLLWGARLISPTGIFADENEETANGGAIERHMIFMTDGNAQAFANNLYAFGSPWWSRRQTSYAPDAADLTAGINARLAALCTAVKDRNIELWVISYGGGVDTTNENRLRTCASPGRYFPAADTPSLISNFQQIAAEIADLRLTE